MSTQTLRALAKDYARGSIDKDSYRKARGELIKNIMNGSIAVKAIDFEPPLRPNSEIEEAITEGIDRDKTQITAPRAATKPTPSQPAPVKKQNVSASQKKSPLIFILVSSAIVLLLIIAVFLFYPKPPTTTSVNVTASDKSATTSALANSNISNEAETLLANFLRANSWHESSMNDLVQAWSNLSEENKNSVTNSKRMQRLKDAIYKQFLEAKALSSIDNEKAMMKQKMLMEFANTIGINDSRLIIE